MEHSVKPLYEGTPAEHKVIKEYDTDHIPPKTEFVTEIQSCLDHYFGPVQPAVDVGGKGNVR